VTVTPKVKDRARALPSHTRQGAARPGPRIPGAKAPSPPPVPQAGMQLHTADGARKYLTAGERDAFLRAAEQAERQARTLCMTWCMAFGNGKAGVARAATSVSGPGPA
jgi:hypothetical protein